MALPSGTSHGSGLSRSEAAILAWKKRARAAKPGALDPKIAARVKEILAAKQKKGKGKAKAKAKGKKVDPAKAKAKAERAKEAAAKKVEREKAKAERVTTAAARKQERETAKRERVAAHVAKQQEAAKKKQASLHAAHGKAKAKAQAAKEKTGARAKASAERTAKQASSAKERTVAAAAAAKEKAAAPAKKQAANRAKVANDMAQQDAGLSPGGSAALGDFADGKPLKEETAKQFEAMGLTEKGSDGQHRLTAEGRAAAAAMDKGDTRAAIDAISRAADKKKPKAKKALDMPTIDLTDNNTANYTFATKAGARHSKMDASHLDEAARHLHAAGATCPDCAPDEEGDAAEGDDSAEKAIKGIMDNPSWYAQHECGDIGAAGSALQTIAMLIGSELSEEDEDDADIGQLCDAARILIKFIGSELDELEGAAGDAAEGRTAGDVPMAKSIELGTLESGEEVATVSGYAIKAIDDTGMVGGYLVKFGGDGDLSSFRDVFTKATNYGTHTKSDVWVHHRMLPGLGKKQLTNQAELGMDDEGVFVKHLLDLRSAYEAKLYGMVQDGKLGWSSGTAPHLVERKALGDGRHEVTQWTLGLDASYTPMPAGGFVVNAGAMKSLFADAGIDLLNAMYIDDSPEAVNPDSARRDGVKADDERARRLVLELSLMELEETAQ